MQTYYNQFMKKLILIFSIVFFNAIYSYSQGINFLKPQTWNDVIKKARAENKSIFVDCFATWCGPCKQMDKDVFRLDNVGKVFNDNFISIKLQFDSTKFDDAYVNEWLNVARLFDKDYNINGFPTYLYFDSTGKLVSKITGAQPADIFLAKSKEFLNPDQQYYTLLERYKKGDHNNVLVKKLVYEALRLWDMETLRSTHEQFVSLVVAPYTKADIMAIYGGITSSESPGFNFLLHDLKQYEHIVGGNGRIGSILRGQISSEVHDRFIKDKGANVPWNQIRQYINSKAPAFTDEVVMTAKVNFFFDQKKWEDFGKLRLDYFDRFAQNFDHNESFTMNNQLMDIFRNCRRKSTLLRAAKWSKYTLDHVFEPDYAPPIDTYANLLYKAGKVADAIDWQKKALEIISKDSLADKSPYVANLKKMQRGLPTWN
jgi:thioredoxin-related protein